MAIAKVFNVTNTGGSGTTAAADTATAAPNLIVIGVGGPSAAYTNGADSLSNTWTNLTAQVSSAGSVATGIDYVLGSPTLGAAHTFTSTSNTFYTAVHAVGFTGVSAFDQSSGVSQTGSGTSHPASSGAMTPAAADCLLISVVCFSANPGTVTPPTGMTLLYQAATGTYLDCAIAYEIQSGTTARTPSWGTTNAVLSCASTAIWTPTGGGGGGSVSNALRRAFPFPILHH